MHYLENSPHVNLINGLLGAFGPLQGRFDNDGAKLWGGEGGQ